MLLLRESDTEGLVSMPEAIEAVEQAFKLHSEQKSVYPPKSQFTLPNDSWRWWGFMPVYLEGLGVSCKIVCDYPKNKDAGRPTIIATLVFCDTDTGEVKAIMDAKGLTAIRTGALGGIAAKYLSRKDSSRAGIIGCGVQARTQLEALAKVRHLELVKISDLSEASMDRFIEDMEHLEIPIVKSTLNGVHDADVIIAATASQNPVVFGADVAPGTHVTSIGAHTPDARELDENFMKKAKLVIDCPDALKSGDLINYPEEIIEIKDVISGRPIRGSADDITLFKSVGTPLQDLAMAKIVYEKAVAQGIGQEIDF